MSAESMLWTVKLLPLLANNSQRVVLLHCAWRANPDGLLWPSAADIAMELGVSVGAVRRTMKELDKEDLLATNPDFRPDGSQGSNYYQLLHGVTPQELLKRRKGRVSRTAIMSTNRKRFENRMERFYGQLEEWAHALSEIRNEISPRVFDMWFLPMKFRGVNKRTLVLGVPSESFTAYFKDGRSRKIVIDAARNSFKSAEIVTAIFRIQN